MIPGSFAGPRGPTGPTGPDHHTDALIVPGPTGPTGGIAPQDSTPIIKPSPHFLAELSKLRRRDLVSISKRLGRISKFPWRQLWAGASLLLFGGAVGGILGLMALQTPTGTQKLKFGLAIGISLGAAILCGAAWFSTKAQRDDSVKAIKAELDEILEAFPLDQSPTKEE